MYYKWLVYSEFNLCIYVKYWKSSLFLLIIPYCNLVPQRLKINFLDHNFIYNILGIILFCLTFIFSTKPLMNSLFSANSKLNRIFRKMKRMLSYICTRTGAFCSTSRHLNLIIFLFLFSNRTIKMKRFLHSQIKVKSYHFSKNL